MMMDEEKRMMDILGVLKPECMPDWAKEKLKQTQAHRQEMYKKHEPER